MTPTILRSLGPYMGPCWQPGGEHPDSFLWWSIASWCLDRRERAIEPSWGSMSCSDFQAHLMEKSSRTRELFGMFLQWWPFFQASPHRGNTIVCGWWLHFLGLFPRKLNLRSILLFNRGGKRLPTSVACSLFNEGVHFCKEPENPQLNAVFSNRIRCWKCTKISSEKEYRPSINQLSFNIHPSIIHHITIQVIIQF